MDFSELKKMEFETNKQKMPEIKEEKEKSEKNIKKEKREEDVDFLNF